MGRSVYDGVGGTHTARFGTHEGVRGVFWSHTANAFEGRAETTVKFIAEQELLKDLPVQIEVVDAS